MANTPRSLLPQPLDEAREPVSHQLPLFTYPTLLDESFTANLLQHELRSEPAELLGYRLIRLAGFEWPVLVAHRGATVSGRLYRDLGLQDYRRLDAYEGVGEDLYYRAEVVVQAAGNREPAAVYLPTHRTMQRYAE